MSSEFSYLGKEVPEYEEYATVAEIDEMTTRLAHSHPSVVEKSTIGKARNGEDITLLRIGRGRFNALLYAFPHPNEPVGSLTVQFVAQKLAEDETLLKKLDFSWYLINCLDREGARRNEPCFRTRDPLSIAKSVLRWPMSTEVESGFPVKYKRYEWKDPQPETRALMSLIDDVRFDFVNCLQDQAAGGVLFTVSRPCEQLYPVYQRLAEEHGQYLHQVGGSQDSIIYVRLSRGVYIHGTAQMLYDWLEDREAAIRNQGMSPIFGAYIPRDIDPVKFLNHGTPSFGYAPLVNTRAFIHMTEVCKGLFHADDPTYYSFEESNKTLADVSVDILNLKKRATDRIQSAFAPVKDSLTPVTRTAVQDQIDHSYEETNLGSKEAQKEPLLRRKATVGETYIPLEIMYFELVYNIGRAYRLLLEEANRTKSAKAGQAVEELSKHMSAWYDDMKKNSYALVPIKRLVGLQVACNFATAEYIRDGRAG